VKIKFLTDEHIYIDIVDNLRSIGIDIKSVQDCGLTGKSDEEILQAAIRENRVLVTRDADFFKIAKKTRHAGIIFLTKSMKIGELIRELQKIHLLYSSEEMMNGIVYLH